jgi:N-methylhydantoinase B
MAQGLQTFEDSLEGSRPDYPSNVGHITLDRGDVVVMRGAGGGGAGDPILRPADLVAADIRDGYITMANAKSAYGVAIGDDGTVDDTETGQLRAQIRRTRISGEPTRAQTRPETPGVAIMRSAGRWSCSYCLGDLGPVEENWRDGAVARSSAVIDLFADAEMYTRVRKSGAPVSITEFFCGSCAGLLGTDIHQHHAARPAAPTVLQHTTAKEN